MIKVTIPATTANLGGGFDCLGIAVNVYNEIYIEEAEQFEIMTDRDLPSGANNLVYRSMSALFDKAISLGMGDGKYLRHYMESKDKTLPVRIRQVNRIPKTSGLGSSAACIVGGVMAANALIGDVFPKSKLASYCAALEGHPDNVLPALFGGITVGSMQGKEVIYTKKNVTGGIKVNLYYPSFALETKQSRKVLPPNYPLCDVVFSMSRALLTFAALTSGDSKLLKNAVGDKLHEPYRSPLIPDYENIRAINEDCGAIACFLSGAGPSVGAFVNDKFKFDRMRERLSFLPNNWRVFECDIPKSGAKVELL